MKKELPSYPAHGDLGRGYQHVVTPYVRVLQETWIVGQIWEQARIVMDAIGSISQLIVGQMHAISVDQIPFARA